MVAIALILAVLVGIALGLLGGGGSILTVPILAYVAGLETKAAVVGSLLVVAVTSGAAVIAHARAGRVRWRTGAIFGGAGVGGALIGGRLGQHVSDHVLLALLAVLMAVSAIVMLRPRRQASATVERDVPLLAALGLGAAFGVVTGLLGAGGGFLVVPALVGLAAMPIEIAIGTSLLIITINSTAGLLGRLDQGHIDWPVTLAFTGIAVVGSIIGARLASAVSPTALRRGFGIFVIVMAALILTKELLA